MFREQAVALKKGDLIKIRSRYDSHLAIIEDLITYEDGSVWGHYKWIGSPGGCAGDMTSDLVTKVESLND